ncbi:TIGR04141 family sporadically distributed protein [Vibrio furnissii]|uniref:DUF6119 family protein n=1 Tax=Vibrio furnissii TaxID=29494 RepID=UPI002573E0AB|nr:DUF6119 family protein [Vibrio furnissii]WJG25192.1 TIGR04141 family sporadically distributed protein [Vibrio furnissii]
MKNRYNIYKLKEKKKDNLLDKLKEVNLLKQKAIDKNNYVLTFYFSEQLKDNPVWWYFLYKDFFNENTKEPRNMSYYAILLIEQKNNENNKYIISLGKSHFYLNKLIVKDFGISIAQRIANEETMSLKKSRLFGGNKRQEISSYINFNIGNYEAGESIDHIKAKASNEALWGNKNIIFSDSIQIDYECSPEDIIEIIKSFEVELDKDVTLNLPKLELVDGEDILLELDELLIKKIKANNSKVTIEEFNSYGVEFLFNSSNFDCCIYYYDSKSKTRLNEKKIQGEITSKDLSDYVNSMSLNKNIENVKVKFKNNEYSFTKPIKELIDCHIDDDSGYYFLRSGEWYYFNECFMDNLKRSLERVDFIKEDDFDELKYISWKKQKENDIANGIPCENKLTYREYYFNVMQSKDNGYILLDRELESIKSLNSERKPYSIEVADLYKNNTAWAVKIGSKKESLIYNIEQSKYSAELIYRKEIKTEYKIKDFGLWFVSTENIEKITDFNSIQLLLAIESWRRIVEQSGGKPKIKYSKIINPQPL